MSHEHANEQTIPFRISAVLEAIKNESEHHSLVELLRVMIEGDNAMFKEMSNIHRELGSLDSRLKRIEEEFFREPEIEIEDDDEDADTEE